MTFSRQQKLAMDMFEKAAVHLRAAEERLRAGVDLSETIEASQECIELSVKAVLSLLNISYPKGHGWEQTTKEFAGIAKQIDERNLLDRFQPPHDFLVPLPRLLFLVNFWSSFYLTAKYGFESGQLASARELFRKEDAEFAVHHAQECHRAASTLVHLEERQLAVLRGDGPINEK